MWVLGLSVWSDFIHVANSFMFPLYMGVLCDRMHGAIQIYILCISERLFTRSISFIWISSHLLIDALMISHWIQHLQWTQTLASTVKIQLPIYCLAPQAVTGNVKWITMALTFVWLWTRRVVHPSPLHLWHQRCMKRLHGAVTSVRCAPVLLSLFTSVVRNVQVLINFRIIAFWQITRVFIALYAQVIFLVPQFVVILC